MMLNPVNLTGPLRQMYCKRMTPSTFISFKLRKEAVLKENMVAILKSLC